MSALPDDLAGRELGDNPYIEIREERRHGRPVAAVTLNGLRRSAANLNVLESQFQRRIEKALDDAGWRWWHCRIPLGSKPGWPDLVMWRPGKYAMRELKIYGKGRVTVEQDDTLVSLAEAGVDTGVWWDTDLDAILDWIAGGWQND